MPNYSTRSMTRYAQRDRETVVQRSILLPSGHFSYLEQGELAAPLIILAHGFPDYPKTFLPLMSRLCTAGYRCAAPYMRGYSPSITSGPYDRQRVGDDLAELADALCPDTPVVLIGHGFGAAATYTAVSRWPQMFRRAVALAVPHVAAFELNLRKSFAQLTRSMYLALVMLPEVPERWVPANDFAFIDRLWKRWSPHFQPDAEYFRELKRCLEGSIPGPFGYCRSLRPTATGLRQSTLDARVAIHVPLLHLHGRDDGCVHYDMGIGQDRYFKAEFRSELLPGLGHFLHLEDPQRVALAILDFIGPAKARSTAW